MICPKCGEGKFRSKSGRLSKKIGKYTRIRTCTKCKYRAKTVEMEIDQYEAEDKLMNDIINAVVKYQQELEQKPEKKLTEDTNL